MVIKIKFSTFSGISVSLFFALMSPSIQGEPAESADKSMEALVTCAVYHRMMAGSFRRVRQMPEMANLESEKMDEYIRLAKDAGKREFGGTEAIDSEVEAVFLESWKYNLNRMENKINRNYKNVSRLTYIYKNKCRKLLE